MYISGRWDVVFNNEVFDSYEIKVTFDSDYPSSLPKVYEVSGRIKHDPDLHLNPPDYHACLFVSHQRWEIWPVGTPFKQFMEIPVHNFFLWQAHYEAFGYWPEGRVRSHGDDGIVEYYEEKFDCSCTYTILALLKETLQATMPPQRKCPCNKAIKLRDCHHGTVVQTLKDNQDIDLLHGAINIFSKRV